MPTDYNTAYKTITNHLLAKWPGAVAGIVDSTPEIRFTGVEKGDIPSTYFARFTMQPVFEEQATFRNGEDKRYTASGLILLQVFAPRHAGPVAYEIGRKLAVAGQSIFRGQTLDGCIILRNVRINWLAPEDAWHRATVIGEYEYDEIG